LPDCLDGTSSAIRPDSRAEGAEDQRVGGLGRRLGWRLVSWRQSAPGGTLSTPTTRPLSKQECDQDVDIRGVQSAQWRAPKEHRAAQLRVLLHWSSSRSSNCRPMPPCNTCCRAVRNDI
jgi:hypothetical protein